VGVQDHEACTSLRRSVEFTIARSHYENINLATMSQGFMPGYNDDELEQIEETVAGPA
jgi:glutamate mutase epsilon subunit